MGEQLREGGQVTNMKWNGNWLTRKNQIMVGNDSQLRETLIRLCHESPMAGHSGINGTIQRIKGMFYWKGISKGVRQFIRNCDVCMRAKHENVALPGLLQPLPIPDSVFSEISMDFIGRLPNVKGKDIIFVVVDRLTKYSHFMVSGHPYSAKEVAQVFIDNVYKLHGCPSSIISDRDPIFLSAFWKEFLALQGIESKLSTAYHPQTDGQTEVVNRCLEGYLHCMVMKRPLTWVKWVALAKWWYNTSFHSSIGMTPFEALYGFPPPLHIPYIPKDSGDKENRMKQQADKHQTEREFSAGSWVYLKLQPYMQNSLRVNKRSKLTPKYFGPFLIVERIGKVAYRLDLPSDSQIHPVFHVSLLKLASGQPGKIIPIPTESRFRLQSLKVLDHKLVKKGSRDAMKILVQWKDQSAEDAMWEYLDELQLPGSGSSGGTSFAVSEAASLPTVGVGLSTSQSPPYIVEDGIGTHTRERQYWKLLTYFFYTSKSQWFKPWEKPIRNRTQKIRYSLKNDTTKIVPKSNQKRQLYNEGKNILKEKLKEIEAFNASSVCATLKKKTAKTFTRREKRARCFICKERGHVLWKCPNKKNKDTCETSKPLFDEKLKYPEIVHVKTNYRVEGSDEQNWNKIWYVGSMYKNHMSPTKSLFKRLKNSFKVLDKEEDERKFIFSYGVGEAIVETKDGTLLIPNVHYTPEFTMNKAVKCSLIKGIENLKVEKEDVQDYIDDEYLNSTSMVESHNKFLKEYFESIDPTVKCSLIKGIENLKMEKEDVQDYIDDEYLSMNRILYAMKDRMCWENYHRLLGKVGRIGIGVSRGSQGMLQRVLGMVKIYYEEAKRSKRERPGKELVGNDKGTVGLKEPQAFAGINAEIRNLINGTPKGTAQVDVKNKGNSEETTNKDLEDYTSSSDDFIIIT
uniref:Integrase catalytic domain-containing protein n=1 Tax=Tanacetum cinerariifolium TaxID=118510 RepID=A0A6L2K6Y1_TANCI|nr:hypothetical protein [Tanacetum cinerariifolium]